MTGWYYDPTVYSGMVCHTYAGAHLHDDLGEVEYPCLTCRSGRVSPTSSISVCESCAASSVSNSMSSDEPPSVSHE
jgi:hypothetical protein